MVNVLKVPTVDATAIPGVDTVQTGNVSAVQTGGVLPGTGSGTDVTTVNKASPEISTIPSPGGPIGTVLNDTANLSGGSSPVGSVTFSLYPPSDAACAQPAVHTETVLTAPYVTTGNFVSNAAGVWHWKAEYSGDANNNPATSPCQAEAVTVDKLNSSTATEVHTSGELVVPNNTSVPNGTTVHDKATVSGSGPTPSGSVTFTFFSGSLAGTCSADAQSVGSGIVPLVEGVAHPSSSQGPLSAGNYSFKASYSGDDNYNSSVSDCEPFTVDKASPTISTTPSVGGVIGVTLNDTATLSGGSSPTGSVTFKLYPPSDPTCSGATSYTDTDPTSPYATSPGFVSNAVGVWHWTASYAGDANNNPASSQCQDETVTVSKIQPTISTTPNPSSGNIGTLLKDSATLSGTSNLDGTGTITFKLFSPSDSTCLAPVDTEIVSGVNVNSPWSTPVGFPAAVSGTYHWSAAFSGDANNLAASSNCQDESVVIDMNHPTIATTLSTSTVNTGTAVHDGATLSGATADAGGNVTYNVYSGNACSGTPVFTSGPLAVTNALVPASGDFTPLTAGTYNWQAVYSGDTKNAGATSPCQSEVLTVNQPAGQYCSPGYWKQTQHFDSWKGFSPSDSFSSVFGRTIVISWSAKGKPGPLTDPSLLKALQANGGGINLIAREAVDALENSESLQFGFTPAQVISAVQAAIDGNNPSLLDKFNLAENCPLN